MGSYPSSSGHKVETLNRPQSGNTEQEAFPPTITPTGTIMFTRHSKEPNIGIFGMWEETEDPGENLHRHEKIMQTPHRRLCQVRIDIFLINVT